jgi:hypothetical protein
MPKIAKIDPENWAKANVVQVDVDAANNSDAIETLERWAAKNGFARVREIFLRVIVLANGNRVFRGACYRITPEEKKAIKFEVDAIEKRAKAFMEAATGSKARR